ncbi:saccharopine dehydrogenase family protein [Desulfosediminicola flagellatus]|uniref:saccharopine dehydrogenase family protein n=1 Tax=Desulfosediminicola flagellatus TaxID=2569541 RepID=UPI0010AD0F23|nr:saccharopine dehydrogenase C-terminal domain-containing protein [Desulfosediminicola flagellatus]
MMDRNIVLLGYGMQGKACVYDLIKYGEFDELSVVDCYDGFIDDINLIKDPRVHGYHVDGTDRVKLREHLHPASLVIEFFPPHLTLQMVELAIDCNCHAITSSYINNPAYTNQPGFAERLEILHEKAQQKNLVILEEFGMDPGIDLAMGQKIVDTFDEVHALHSYGAGFPELQSANNPLKYKFTWSVIGVIRSHLRPATYLKNCEVVEIPADSMFASDNTHRLEIPGLGDTLECFYNGNSTQYVDHFGIEETVKSMGRYICRWPGHGAFWERMAKCGFLSDQPIQVGEQQVKPDEFCASLLGNQEQFHYQNDESDIALLRVDGRGIIDGQPKQVLMQAIIYHDKSSGFSAMQQTVGFPMAIGSMMILNGKITNPGRTMPMEVPLDLYFNELERRGIHFEEIINDWDGQLNP